ncbi:hypothetical protein AD998_14920 [bacterium 336/3]|nr:hypothetical protein AD998_14920 [bacterium 336/3]
MNFKLFLSAFFSFFVWACSNKTTNNPENKDKNKRGTLYYHSKLDKEGRLILNEGDKIVAQAQLHYHSKPKGVMDGDGGTNLYLEIPSEMLLETGKSYDIHNETLACFVTNWASPYHHEVLSKEKVKGKFSIVTYQKYEYLRVEFDISLIEPNHDFKGFKDTIEFSLGNPWHKVPENNINWEGFSKESTKKIAIESITGSWEARNLINKNFQDKTDLMDTLLHVKLPYPLIIEKNSLKSHLTNKETLFTLEENQLILKDEYRTVGFINFLDKKNLTITWKNKYNYQRLRYERK